MGLCEVAAGQLRFIIVPCMRHGAMVVMKVKMDNEHLGFDEFPKHYVQILANLGHVKIGSSKQLC